MSGNDEINEEALKKKKLADFKESQIAFDYKNFLKKLTTQPGVYQFYDSDGKILYVGKAKNLKNRVSSYFRSSGLTRKTQALVRKTENANVTVTPSEAEALVLEHNLIKSQKPPFNIALRDDKSFPFIFMSQEEDYPRLSFHRGSKKKKGQYFGPFPSAGATRETLNFLQKTFGVRQCEDSVFKNRSRPCLQFQIGRCTAPCVEEISKEDYAQDVNHVSLFLEGKSEQLHTQIAKNMEQASADLEFEKAARYRDKITALRKVQAQQTMETGYSKADVIACEIQEGEICLHRLYVRQGKIIGSRSYFPKNKLENTASEVLSAFVAHSYLSNNMMDVPPMIILSHPLEDEKALSDAICKTTGKQVKVTSTVRTYRASWQAMAIETARQNLRARLNDKQTAGRKMLALQKQLEREDPINRVECFDISHSSGEKTVASCVVFGPEGAIKNDYRRFNIDGITGGDDYAAMRQAVTRRYTRLLKEQSPLPDLLLIDGGRGQINTVNDILDELDISSIELVGVAKGTTRKPGFETLVFPDGREKVLPSDAPELHLIQQIRDEAHRFAITGHKNRRDKARRTSSLEDIPGVGATRRRDLLKHFGGLQEVKRANIDDLAKVQGISKKMAQEIYSYLNSE